MGVMVTLQSTLIRLSGALALTLGAMLPVAAEDAVDPAAPGQARSTAFATLPPGAAIAVRPLDNSDANLRVAANFADALTKRGFRSADTGARYALNFDIEVQPIRQPLPKQTTGELRSAPSTAVNNDLRGNLTDPRGNLDDGQVRFKMGVANPDDAPPPRRGDLTSRGALRYVMTATLDDQQGGQRLWQGEATFADSATEEQAAYTMMANALVDQLGRTVRQRSFGGE
jgi:hypothetical protein